MMAKVFLLCLSLLVFQSFAELVSSKDDQVENPDSLRFWHPRHSLKPLKPRIHPPWPKTKWPLFPHPPMPSRLPKTKWPFPHPPLPSWRPKTKWPFTHPPLPSWLPKTKFPHPPLPSWMPKTKWPFPHPPLPSWPWLPHGSKCPSTHAVVESCMKEGTYSNTDTNGGYKFSAECCKSVAEIKDECSDELYVPLIKYQCMLE